MVVVTAGTTEYRAIVDAQARKCKEFGYRHMVFDLGGLGIGEPYAVEREDLEPSFNGDSLPPATFKAALVERGLAKALEGEVVCWLDADCIPLSEFNPDATILGLYHRFDAAVTLRPAPEVGQCGIASMDFLNSGVVWFRNSFAGRSLCRQWWAISRIVNTDQGALNLCVMPEGQPKEIWLASLGRVVKSQAASLEISAKVMVLDAMEWNSWHPPFTGARIAHFKRGLRGQAVNYL